jgi:hypothetical protein
LAKIAALLQAFGFERWLLEARKSAAMWAGFLFPFFAGGKKENKINSSNFAPTYQRAKFRFLIFKLSTNKLSVTNFTLAYI